MFASGTCLFTFNDIRCIPLYTHVAVMQSIYPRKICPDTLYVLRSLLELIEGTLSLIKVDALTEVVVRLGKA